jgi:hypothetical protein
MSTPFNLTDLHVYNTVKSVFINSGIPSSGQTKNFTIQDVLKNEAISNTLCLSNPRQQLNSFSVQNIFSNTVANDSFLEGFNPNPTPPTPSNQLVAYTPIEFSSTSRNGFSLVKNSANSDTSANNIVQILPANAVITRILVEKVDTLVFSGTLTRFYLYIGNPLDPDNISLVERFSLANINNNQYVYNYTTRPVFTESITNDRYLYLNMESANTITSGSLKITLIYGSTFEMYTPTEFSTIDGVMSYRLVKESNQSSTNQNSFKLPNNSVQFTGIKMQSLTTLEELDPETQASFSLSLGNPSTASSLLVNSIPFNSTAINNGGIISTNNTFTGSSILTREIYIKQNTVGAGLTAGSAKIIFVYLDSVIYTPTQFITELITQNSRVALVRNKVQSSSSPTAIYSISQNILNISQIVIENIDSITYTGQLPTFELKIGSASTAEPDTDLIATLSLNQLNNGATIFSDVSYSTPITNYNIFVKLTTNSVITGGGFKVRLN